MPNELGAGRKQAATGRGAHQGKRIEVYLDGSCRGALVDHDVDAEVLHRRIQILLHDGREAMDLVDEKHVAPLQRGKDAGKVARLVEDRARGDLETHAQLVGDDVAQSGLSQSGRTMEQGVVERLATVFGCFDKYAQVIDYALLAAKVVET